MKIPEIVFRALLFFFCFSSVSWAEDAPQRVASLLLSQDLVNEQIAAHNKSQLVKDVKLQFDADHQQLYLRGIAQVPLEELRALNLPKEFGAFRFQVTIKPETTPEGYLILEFPLRETYFYPAGSKDPENDKIVVPVQLLSVALASFRGYLAALSGDFSGFDKREAKLKALINSFDSAIKHEKNAEAKDELRTQRDQTKLQLEALPLERKQMMTASKAVEHMLSFTGEKELNLNEELGARTNAIVLKIRMSQIAPMLDGVSLGGIRMVRDKLDGHGENFVAIDINSVLGAPIPPLKPSNVEKKALANPPSVIMKLNQALFESKALLDLEKKEAGSKLPKMELELHEDGLHVNGAFKTFFFTIPFETIVDFKTTGVDEFVVKVRDIEVAGIDLEFLSEYLLKAVQSRLELAMKGLCHFEYIGERKDKSRAMKVTVDAAKLVPAFPDLHLLRVDLREREFLLKIGKP